MADFLRRRREALTPEAAGIRVLDRRRTPGLRRDEVAERANMSAVYYERLERGRGPVPSASMLGGIARALRLTADECAYLYRLAGQAAPPTGEPSGFVDPGLADAMAAVAATVAAAIVDELGTVVAQNRLNETLFGAMAGTGNIVWRWFTEPAWRAWQEPAEQHAETGRAYVADLRAVLGRRAGDPVARRFVADLREASPEFAAIWDEHPVAVLRCPPKRIADERVGLLDLECSVMLSPLSSQRLLLLRPANEQTRTACTWLAEAPLP